MSEIQLEKVLNILDFSCIIKITTNVQALMPHDQDTGGGIHGKEDDHGDVYKRQGLSHNTVRGAAGGAVLCAELLTEQGYITHK